MLLIGLFSWWYGAGWLQLTHRLWARIENTFDFFSIGLLFKTLFAPFKQLSVGRVQGSVQTQLRAWFDSQLSRAIGAMVRLAVIAFGIIVLVFMLLVSMVLLFLWPLVPILPLIVVLVAIGGGQ